MLGKWKSWVAGKDGVINTEENSPWEMEIGKWTVYGNTACFLSVRYYSKNLMSINTIVKKRWHYYKHYIAKKIGIERP